MTAARIYLMVTTLIVTSCSVLQQPNLAAPVPVVPPLSEPFPAPNPEIPNFDHIVTIIFENKEFDSVIDSSDAPYINQLAGENTLLTQYYAITHPSLPNYIALIGGDTYGYTETCKNCPVDANNLADLIERSGRSWRSYQESMPKHCLLWTPSGQYVAKHNPFLYFSNILNDDKRCSEHVVDWEDLGEDMDNGSLPNFIFISPNICSSGHDCTLNVADDWLEDLMPQLIQSLQADGDNYLIFVTWDEGETTKSCCGLPESAGGRIATFLVSPRAKSGFEDPTPYTTYSLLRTVSEAWGLPLLGHAADDTTLAIIAPWE